MEAITFPDIEAALVDYLAPEVGVTVAATYYQVPWLQIASAVVAPFAVYAIPNEAAV